LRHCSLSRALFWLDEQHLSLEAKQFWFVPNLGDPRR
jgi:hypothetical protein